MHMFHDESKSIEKDIEPVGFFKGVPPKTSFVFGIVSGVAAVALLLLVVGLFSRVPLGTKTSSASTSASTTGTASLPAAPAAQVATGKLPAVSDQDHVLGDKTASLTFVEYGDFECPFCKKFEPTLQQMMQEYKGKIKLVYRHFPLSFHANAPKEAEATECANELGGNDAFWKYHDAILDRTTSGGTGFSLDALVPLAKELGLDESKFKDCLDNGKYAQHVQQDETGGQAAGVNGTPGSFLIDKQGNSQLVSGAVPYTQIKSLIDAALAK